LMSRLLNTLRITSSGTSSRLKVGNICVDSVGLLVSIVYNCYLFLEEITGTQITRSDTFVAFGPL
jgi:hypothetical protein